MTGRYKKMKKGKSWVIILVAVICIGLLGWLGWYSTAVITDTKQKQEATANGESTKDKDYQNIKLGLDLSGGVSITYHIKDKNPSDKDVNDTIAKLEERAESYTTEYSVYKSGDDRITAAGSDIAAQAVIDGFAERFRIDGSIQLGRFACDMVSFQAQRLFGTQDLGGCLRNA